jgi:hypothetical protein
MRAEGGTGVPDLEEVVDLVDGKRLEKVIHTDRGAYVGVEGVATKSQQE